MKKLESLRASLLASVPQLRGDPSKLEIYVDKGEVTTRAGSLSFEYGYTASIWVQEYAGDVDKLLVPLLAWTAENQPDLFEAGDRKPFSFESDLLDAQTYDITVTIQLTELVRVEEQAKGLKVTHVDEPRLLDQFDGVPSGTRLWCAVLADLVAGTFEILP